MPLSHLLYKFFFVTTEIPKFLGLFHILSLITLGLLIFLVFKKFNNLTDEKFRRIMFYIWIFIVLGEIYREICFSLALTDDGFTFNYAWYMFPFQMCSAPLYALPLIAFLPSGKVRDGVMAYMSTFSMFGGLSVMIYVGDVYTVFLGSNIQSMTHHGLQVLIGLMVILHNKDRYNKHFFLRGLCTFGAALCIAMTLNVVGYHALRAAGKGDTFNMFYISPYFKCTLPILSAIHEATSYLVVLPLYILAFSLIALLMFTITSLIIKKCSKAEKI